MIKRVICDECEFSFSIYSLDEEETERGDTEISFSCPSCMEKYVVEYTNENIEKLKEELRDRIEKAALAREHLQLNKTKERREFLREAMKRRDQAQRKLEREMLSLEETYREQEGD